MPQTPLGGKVPKGWDRCPNIGEKIAGTPFISFKAPIGPGWFVADLVRNCPDLKMVIDLTNTDKYYKPSSLQTRGVRHVKVETVGGGKVSIQQSILIIDFRCQAKILWRSSSKLLTTFMRCSGKRKRPLWESTALLGHRGVIVE